jgi:hypothetical protein
VNAPELKTIAGELAGAGAPGLPTVVLAREVPLFEVEFAALEFAEEVKLPSSDWAALALARALGEITPADVDAYLGLGEAVSEGLVRRLLEEALLEEGTEASKASPQHVEESGLSGFFRRLFGAKTTPTIEARPAPVRAITTARKLRDSRASTSPMCRLSTAGMQALERGAVTQRRVRAARLLFLAEPLLYLGVVDEKRHRHTQHRRPIPLEPERVPEPLRVLDATLGLPPNERVGACGIEGSIRGFSGQFVGVVPGAQWEVRRLERRAGKGREQQMALLVVAAFPSSDEGGVRWRAYLRQQEQTQDCPHLDAARLLDPDLRSLPRLLSAIKADSSPPMPESLRVDGAFELRCDAGHLPGLLGEADQPEDTYLPALAINWWVGLRAHAMPSNIDAGRAAFYEFLRRRDSDLRRNFDATCGDVAASLTAYWGENPGLPSADDAANNLWARAELRAALCMRRRHADLVAPYERTEAAR